LPGSIRQRIYLGKRFASVVNQLLENFNNRSMTKINWSRFICISVLSLGAMRPLSVLAQEEGGWKVILNKKVVLQSTTSEDTSQLVLRIKKEQLNNNGIFKIDYSKKKNKDMEGSWQRTIAFFEPGETSVFQKDSTTQLYVYNKDMLKLLWSRKKLIVYTWATPPDPGMAAVIRIRRERLFSIELEE
jgi:hypothetical protein